MSNTCRKLSVAVIVRDAEDCLAATLDSVRNLADEIVVLDTGSRDSTVRIARQKATKVVTHTWTDDFAAARNAALAEVTGDWVLWLDAGETIPFAAAEGLRRLVDREADPQTVYYLLIRTPAQGANIAGEQVAQVRLHPRLPDLQFHGRIRESLRTAIEQLELKTAGLAFTLHRGAREHNQQLCEQRAKRNLRLAKLAIGDEGPQPRLLNCLGEAAQALGDHTASSQFHRAALAHSAAGSGDMLEAYYGQLTAMEGEPNSRDSQLRLCMQALDAYPLDAQLLCAVGGYLQSQGHLEFSARAYQLSAQHGQINLEIWHLEGLQEITTNCYAHTLQLLGREQDAIQLLQQELAVDPLKMRLRRQLLELHVNRACYEEALAVANAMPRGASNREALRSAVRGACHAAEGNWILAKTYLEAAHRDGCQEPLCLRWLTQTQLALGEAEAASATFEQWSAIDPLSGDLRRAGQALLESEPRRSLRVDQPAAAITGPSRLGSVPALPKSVLPG